MTEAEREQLVAWAAAHDKVRPCSRSPQPGCASSRRWEDELAPQTVAAFKGILPLEDRIIHCRWSGESNWIPWGDRDLGIGPENATSYPHPGELALYPGGESETELLFPYGYCSFASKAGAALGEPLRDARRGPGAVEGARPADALGGGPADLVPRDRRLLRAAPSST